MEGKRILFSKLAEAERNMFYKASAMAYDTDHTTCATNTGSARGSVSVSTDAEAWTSEGVELLERQMPDPQRFSFYSARLSSSDQSTSVVKCLDDAASEKLDQYVSVRPSVTDVADYSKLSASNSCTECDDGWATRVRAPRAKTVTLRSAKEFQTRSTESGGSTEPGDARAPRERVCRAKTATLRFASRLQTRHSCTTTQLQSTQCPQHSTLSKQEQVEKRHSFSGVSAKVRESRRPEVSRKTSTGIRWIAPPVDEKETSTSDALDYLLVKSGRLIKQVQRILDENADDFCATVAI